MHGAQAMDSDGPPAAGGSAGRQPHRGRAGSR